MAEEDEDTNWTMQLDSVARIESDDPEDDGNLFGVEFKAVGPNINAELEVLVIDIADEAQVVVEATEALQIGLETWARVVARRKGVGNVEPGK